MHLSEWVTPGLTQPLHHGLANEQQIRPGCTDQTKSCLSFSVIQIWSEVCFCAKIPWLIRYTLSGWKRAKQSLLKRSNKLSQRWRTHSDTHTHTHTHTHTYIHTTTHTAAVKLCNLLSNMHAQERHWSWLRVMPLISKMKIQTVPLFPPRCSEWRGWVWLHPLGRANLWFSQGPSLISLLQPIMLPGHCRLERHCSLWAGELPVL